MPASEHVLPVKRHESECQDPHPVYAAMQRTACQALPVTKGGDPCLYGADKAD